MQRSKDGVLEDVEQDAIARGDLSSVIRPDDRWLEDALQVGQQDRARELATFVDDERGRAARGSGRWLTATWWVANCASRSVRSSLR